MRVPPSACSTSQSIMIEFSPSRSRSTTARSDLPISRWISCVRPSIAVRLRRRRSSVAAGSMSYSAVTHPLPVPIRHLGTLASHEAVHKTRVLPARIKTEPAGFWVYPRLISTGRSSVAFLPSCRANADPYRLGSVVHIRILNHRAN